jgi:hypothetical protein
MTPLSASAGIFRDGARFPSGGVLDVALPKWACPAPRGLDGRRLFSYADSRCTSCPTRFPSGVVTREALRHHHSI